MKIKYKGKSGKREVRKCEQCKKEFETLSIKVRKGGEKFCSIECYKTYRNNNRKNRDEKFDHIMYQKKYKYGLDKTQYLLMVESQKNRCCICDTEFTNENKYSGPCVDHCHIKNEVRGLLCQDCNKGLGSFKDNIIHLYKAIEYLKSSSVTGSSG